jgi:hypothetical protein
MTCAKCNKTYPASEEYFYRQKYTTKTKGVLYRLTCPCKECRKKDNAEYTRNNMEMHNESMQKYYNHSCSRL